MLAESTGIQAFPARYVLNLARQEWEKAVELVRGWGKHYANQPLVSGFRGKEMLERLEIQVDSQDEKVLCQMFEEAGVASQAQESLRIPIIQSSLERGYLAKPVKKGLEQVFPGEAQVWDKQWGKAEQARGIVEQAYLEAVAPVMAQAILFYPANVFVSATIGGGRGHFSRQVKPAVEDILRDKQDTRLLDVTETDQSRVVFTAPSKALVTHIQGLSYCFPKGSLSMVFGENVVHHAKRFELGEWIRQIKTTINDQGFFLHVRDNVPNSEYWGSKELNIRMLARGRKPAVMRIKESQVEKAMEISTLAHNNLELALRGAANKNGLFFKERPVQASLLIPDSLSLPGFMSKNNNRFFFNHGILEYGRDELVPPGQRQIAYSGTITLMAKDPALLEVFQG